MKTFQSVSKALAVTAVALSLSGSPAFAESVDLRSLLMNGLLGAGVGAISAEVSGGKAGTGALIGAGTNIIGGALLGFLTQPSSGFRQAAYPERYYPAEAPVSYYTAPVQAPVYSAPVQQAQPVYYTPTPAPAYSYSYPQDDPNKKIIKQGLLGAGVGAISSIASGGSAGKGALIGAGTNVLGGAVLDFLTQTPAPAAAYTYYPAASSASAQTAHKRIVRKYDAEGKLISEEEFWD